MSEPEKFPDVRALAAAQLADETAARNVGDEDAPTERFERKRAGLFEPLALSDRAFMGLIASCGAPIRDLLAMREGRLENLED